MLYLFSIWVWCQSFQFLTSFIVVLLYLYRINQIEGRHLPTWWFTQQLRPPGWPPPWSSVHVHYIGSDHAADSSLALRSWSWYRCFHPHCLQWASLLVFVHFKLFPEFLLFRLFNSFFEFTIRLIICKFLWLVGVLIGGKWFQKT